MGSGRIVMALGNSARFLPASLAILRALGQLQIACKKAIGRSGEIRTPDPLLPKQVRYQAALRSDLTGKGVQYPFDAAPKRANPPYSDSTGGPQGSLSRPAVTVPNRGGCRFMPTELLPAKFGFVRPQ